MRKLAIVLLAGIAASAWAQSTYVKPHVRKDGTYVEGHYRTKPNSSQHDNYGSKGNYNPYTGQSGTVDPFKGNDGGFNQPRQQNPYGYNPYQPKY